MSKPADGHRESGQNTFEYIGLAFLVATIVGVLLAFTPLSQQLSQGIRSAVCTVVGKQECPSFTQRRTQHSNKNYRPKFCLTGQHKTQYGVEASVVATLGGDVLLVRQRLSNGKVRLRAVQEGHAGIEVGIGFDAQWGKLVNAGAEANIGATVKGGAGKTWVFNNDAAAHKWVDNIRKNNRLNAFKNTGVLGRVGGEIYDALDNSEVPKEPKYTRYRVGLDVHGNAGANAGIGLEFGGSKKSNKEGEDLGNPTRNAHKDDGRGHDEAAVNPEFGAELKAKIGGEAILRKNNRNGDITTVYKFTAQASVAGKWLGKNRVAGIPLKASGKFQGQMYVTRTSSGEPKKIKFVTSAAVNQKPTVTTTTLKLDTPRKQRVARKFVRETSRIVATGDSSAVPWINTAPTKRPGGSARPMEQLLYSHGKVTQARYKISKNPWKGGIEGKYGVKFGLSGHRLASDKKLLSAKYLGRPQGDKRSFVQYTRCMK